MSNLVNACCDYTAPQCRTSTSSCSQLRSPRCHPSKPALSMPRNYSRWRSSHPCHCSARWRGGTWPTPARLPTTARAVIAQHVLTAAFRDECLLPTSTFACVRLGAGPIWGQVALQHADTQGRLTIQALLDFVTEWSDPTRPFEMAATEANDALGPSPLDTAGRTKSATGRQAALQAVLLYHSPACPPTHCGRRHAILVAAMTPGVPHPVRRRMGHQHHVLLLWGAES